MAFIDEIREALKDLVTEKVIFLNRPSHRTELAFRSTIYNALSQLNLKAKVRKDSDSRYRVEIDRASAGRLSSRSQNLTSPLATLEVILASAILIRNDLLGSVEFIGESIDSIKQEAGEHVDFSEFQLSETPASTILQKPTKEVSLVDKPHLDLLE